MDMRMAPQTLKYPSTVSLNLVYSQRYFFFAFQAFNLKLSKFSNLKNFRRDALIRQTVMHPANFTDSASQEARQAVAHSKELLGAFGGFSDRDGRLSLSYRGSLLQQKPQHLQFKVAVIQAHLASADANSFVYETGASIEQGCFAFSV